MSSGGFLLVTVLGSFLLTSIVYGGILFVVMRLQRDKKQERELAEKKAAAALEQQAEINRQKEADEHKKEEEAARVATARRRSLEATVSRYESLDNRADITQLREATTRMINVLEKFLLGMELNGDNRYTVSMTPEDLLAAQQAITFSRRSLSSPPRG